MEKVKILCGSCKVETNHGIVAEYNTRDDMYDGEIQIWSRYQIVQCLGCDNTSFRSSYTCSEEIDHQTGDLVETVSLYPDWTKRREPMPGNEAFPLTTKRVYMETLKALSNQTPILAAIGLRAIVESICLEQKTTSKNLKEGIDELAAMGLLSVKQAEFLHNHRFMGNEAAHEIVAPKPQHLVAALDIAETLLKTIYVLPNMADQLKKTPTKASG